MTRAELIAKVVASHPQFAEKKVEASVKTILDALAKSMAQKGSASRLEASEPSA